ncbi:MAG: catalase [Deltaproteobacteria bacterium]|nr:catalase [Deltaproteobacteria bacterium]
MPALSQTLATAHVRTRSDGRLRPAPARLSIAPRGTSLAAGAPVPARTTPKKAAKTSTAPTRKRSAGKPAASNERGRKARVEKATEGRDALGRGGELHQAARPGGVVLTTNQGVAIADDQNSLTLGERGPTLLEDFVLREKITHFDHERIPERIVHARGSAAHGYFQPTKSLAHLTRAAFLQDPEVRTPVFVRFSTVAGGAGSVDLPRDVRGFAVKFYTEEGNFDLVGNNIPVFFIQDAMKFPDLVHAVKMEPDRGFPQAASAHATFWDFVSLMPESMHMLMWAMSDRAIPRSLRFMDGFGIHTFRFIDHAGHATFVKFHWRPRQGVQSVLWPEAVAINGADQDYHRRDLWQAIERGDYPEFELAIQSFDEDFAERFEFDVLDPTKLIPEELVPLEVIGKLVLDRNPDNFFAETEQAAFHPGHVVPGIDFSNDPLLQGRLFSYLDTQLSRLGGPNFHELPINRPRCPMHNFQRDGIARMEVATGRVNYEPNSLATDGPRESARGFTSHPAEDGPHKLRVRPASFADHYSQARLFWRSMSEVEQRHIASAFAFELGKVEVVAIRRRMLGHLDLIEPALGEAVAGKLGMRGEAEVITPAREPIDLPPAPSLSMLGRGAPTLSGRNVAALVGDGCDAELLGALRDRLEQAGAVLTIIAPQVAGVHDDAGDAITVDEALLGAPSCLFDAIVVLLPGDAALPPDLRAAATAWIRDAHTHCKVIGLVDPRWLTAAGVAKDDGVIGLEGKRDIAAFVERAGGLRVFSREGARDTKPAKRGARPRSKA